MYGEAGLSYYFTKLSNNAYFKWSPQRQMALKLNGLRPTTMRMVVGFFFPRKQVKPSFFFFINTKKIVGTLFFRNKKRTMHFTISSKKRKTKKPLQKVVFDSRCYVTPYSTFSTPSCLLIALRYLLIGFLMMFHRCGFKLYVNVVCV